MHAAASDVVLSLKGLQKSYGDLVAVKDLSLDVYRGEVFGFLGPNGAGKTTTIKMICGLLKSDAGEILINNRSLNDHYRECKRTIGLCPEDLVIWESLTCLEQLEFIGRQYDLSRDAAKKKALELLDILGLIDKRNTWAKELSSGMKRRLNIALALVHDPEILILDEPQAGLDPQSRILIREYIRSLSKRITVILTTHDMDEVDKLADRVGIIDNGQMLVLDTPEGLKSRIGAGDILEIKIAAGQDDKLKTLKAAFPKSLRDFTYQDETLRIVNIDTLGVLPVLLEEFQHAHLEILDITIRKKTLEDVFIDLTGRRLRE
ncbi:MAG: ABC transporter ATP-binding protein [Anaerolineales bacterium]|nr:ABC transporter ATP-binding protein [Anaerolineales bacterium]